MREAELERLQQAVNRLIGAHEEALDAARRGLEFGEVGSDDDVQAAERSRQLESALIDVLDILEGASEDVRGILGDANEERGG